MNNETWEWDGATWTQRLVGAPGPRFHHAMVYDESRGVTVLFGGHTNINPLSPSPETWEWDGTAWALFPLTGPSARGQHAMAYDAARRTTVLFGGWLAQEGTRSDQIWGRGIVCYPDCNASGTLTVADFGCFQTKFVAGDPYADCNGDGVRTVADFGCFQTKFVSGCP